MLEICVPSLIFIFLKLECFQLEEVIKQKRDLDMEKNNIVMKLGRNAHYDVLSR